MKEMSLFKILTGVFAFLMCLLLVLTPCFGFATVATRVSTSSKNTSFTFTGYDLLLPEGETADDTTMDQLYDSLKMDYETVNAMNTVCLIGKIDVIVMIVVGAVGMVLSALSIFLFSARANKAIAVGFSSASGVLAVLLTVLSIIFVATMNNFVPVSSASLLVVKTSAYVALILMAVVAVAYIVYAVIAKRNGKTSVGGDVRLGVASKIDIEDTTIKLLVAYKKAADEGVVGEMDFVEMKRAALIASNRGDAAYLQKQLYGIEKLTAYKMLFDQGVLTESEFNYKKNHLSGTAM